MRDPRGLDSHDDARGLLLLGLDLIGDRLTEIDVIRPTGLAEIAEQAGFDATAMFIGALEAAVAPGDPP